MVYGIAGLLSTSQAFSPNERLILVVFLVIFPVVAIILLYRLASRYQSVLYGPRDFKDEKNFVKMVERSLERSRVVQQIRESAQLRAKDAVEMMLEQSDRRLYRLLFVEKRSRSEVMAIMQINEAEFENIYWRFIAKLTDKIES